MRTNFNLYRRAARPLAAVGRHGDRVKPIFRAVVPSGGLSQPALRRSLRELWKFRGSDPLYSQAEHCRFVPEFRFCIRAGFLVCL